MPGPVVLCGVEQARRAAGPGLALGPVGHEFVETGDVEPAVRGGVHLGETQLPDRDQVAQFTAEDHVLRLRRAVDHDDVVEVDVAQHAHHGCDAAAGRQEEHLRGRGRRQHEVTGRLFEPDQRARRRPADQVVADLAVPDRLHGDRDAAVPAVRRRGDGVGAPQPRPVDVDPDPHVLAGRVTAPVPSRSDHDGRGVTRLGVHGLDAPTQVGARTERADQVEVVRRQQRRRDHLQQFPGPAAEGCTRHDSSLLRLRA